VQLQLLGFDHAGAGDEEEGPVVADFESAQLHGVSASTPPAGVAAFCRRARSARDAFTKPTNSGCGSRGVEVNSGCAWQARNQGWPASSIISTRLPSPETPLITMPCWLSSSR